MRSYLEPKQNRTRRDRKMLSDKMQIKSVRGTQDILPAEYEKRRQAWEAIQNVFRQFGYRGVEIPTIESIDLHLRKSGEAIRRHMYSFKDLGNETLCLRPELTASVVRMFISKLWGEKLPQKLYYLGSVFRYDKPQKGRYREFTQAGIECIGGATPEYDAEVIALACRVMEELHISDYEVVIGNIGIVLELLSQKKIDERVKNYIVESLETLSKSSGIDKGIQEIEEGLEKIGISMEELPREKVELLEAVKKLPEAQARKVVAWVIDTIYGSTGGDRDSQEIAGNLLAKITRDEERPQIRETLNFIRELTQIHGVPPKVFGKVDSLIQRAGLDPKPIEELRLITEYLDHYGVDWSKVRIDFSFGRGLAYYTGMIFEIYCHSKNLGADQKQVCGGGRYDDLIGYLGGASSVPALGLSFGLERLILAMEGYLYEPEFLDAFVAPVGGEKEFRYALDIARRLREAGLRTDIGAKDKSVKAQLRMADSLGTKFVLLLGEEERKENAISLRDMRAAKQIKCSMTQAIETMKKGVAPP